MSTQTARLRRPRWWRSPRGEPTVVGYTLLLPAVIGLAVFVVAPIVMAFYISTTDWSGIGGRPFIGTDNYEELLHDDAFRHSLEVTLKYTVLFVPLLYVLSLALALL